MSWANEFVNREYFLALFKPLIEGKGTPFPKSTASSWEFSIFSVRETQVFPVESFPEPFTQCLFPSINFDAANGVKYFLGQEEVHGWNSPEYKRA